jgi:hypothetical protein
LLRDAEAFKSKLGGLFGGKEVGDFLVKLASEKAVEGGGGGGKAGAVNSGNDDGRVISSNGVNGKHVNGAGSTAANGSGS